jgi:hypothetical protein
MVDLFANLESRSKFLTETEELAADALDGGVVALRKLLADEPLAILYCVDGTFVKISPSFLKTTHGFDDSPHCAAMREMVQNSYEEYLARNKGDDITKKHFGTAEVSSRVGARVGSSVTCFVCVCAQALGLVQVACDGTQLLFNWQACAELPWADAGVHPFCSL